MWLPSGYHLVYCVCVLQAYLVYASSSSVYGKRASVPFSSEEPLRAPGNLYAASKIMNEHLAAAYCSQHGLLSIGLRFFTVYGPWGRPDMAAYKFAESIVTGKPVPLFEASAGQQLKRDFTYVEDIVSGVLSALQHTPARCGETYNLGYGRPLVVEGMLNYLQQELDTHAIIVSLPGTRTTDCIAICVLCVCIGQTASSTK